MRLVNVAAAQMGPIQRDDSRAATITAITKSLGRIGIATPEVVSALAGLLKSGSTPHRIAAARALVAELGLQIDPSLFGARA